MADEEKTQESGETSTKSIFTTQEVHNSAERIRKHLEELEEARRTTAPPPSPSVLIRAQNGLNTVGIRMKATVMKNRWSAILATAAIIAVPTWFAATIHYGTQIDYLENRIEELVEDVEDLEDERDDLIKQLLDN